MKARSFPDMMEERVFYYGDNMNYLWFAFGFISCYIFFELAKSFLIINSFMKMEKFLILSSMNLLQYKYHAIQLMKIVYDKAAEQDPASIEEGKQVINKIEERFDHIGNLFVVVMQNSLPYKLKYKSWKEAIEYAETLINKE